MPQLEQSSLQPSTDLQHRHLLQTTSYNHLLLLHLLISRKGKLKQQQARTPPPPPLDGGLRSQKGLRPFNPLQRIVYSHQAVQYVNGKFFGAVGGEITKTMMCVMMKSIAGKYRDIVAMAPVVNINADKLHLLWTDVVNKVIKIGFDVAVTMTDGHSSNMNFFNKKMLKKPTDVFALDEFGSDVR